jgi:hypothetical protein
MEARKLFKRLMGSCVAIALAIVFLLVATQHIGAHTPVTSRYDYNKDVFPLFRDHCAVCHVEGGPAPMSLMSYKSAMPWAQSIRDELTAGRMPPWPVDPTSPPIKGGYPASSRDIDVMVVWASGGTPESYTDAKPPGVAFNPKWQLGPPDLKIAMDAEHTVPPTAIEEVSDFSLPANVTETKWIKAADLLPGAASIVRDAVISIENGPVLALWQPGSDTTATPSGAAFRLAPGSRIHLQIHYKKHFDQEQNAVSDRSTIGLYFSDPPPSGQELQSLVLDPPEASGDPNRSSIFEGAFGGTLPKAGRIVGLRPMLDRAYESLSVDAITPSGTTVPLFRLHGPRPQWFRRYWLQEPVELASGSKVSVRLTPLADYSDEPKVAKRFPLQVILDYAPL